MTTISEQHHDWELSKENSAPLERGRSTKSLSKRAFGTSAAEMGKIEEKTKKYEKAVRRDEKAVEWMQKHSKLLIERRSERQQSSSSKPNETSSSSKLTKEESQSLRLRLTSELGFDPSTPDRDHVDHDPIRYWILYIKHIGDNYPSDSQRQFLVMERCARTFMARPFVCPNYANDPRYIRACILYAETAAAVAAPAREPALTSRRMRWATGRASLTTRSCGSGAPMRATPSAIRCSPTSTLRGGGARGGQHEALAAVVSGAEHKALAAAVSGAAQ